MSKTITKEAEVGSIVDIFYNGKEWLLKLVDSGEADPFTNRISIDSPLGRALMHKHEYDLVNVNSPRHRESFIIKHIY